VIHEPTESLDPELRSALRDIARTPQLLVASDYDGTLAPIVADPSAARPLTEAIAGVRALALLPNTTVAVVSGRALRDLAALSRLPSEVHLVGSHGSEFDLDFVHAIDEPARHRLRAVTDECRALVDGIPGAEIEVKPASVAVHVRRVERSDAGAILDQVLAGPGRWDGIHVTQGKEVVELAVVETDKGGAVDRLRHQTGSTAVLFVGDDVTDEKAFARLRGGDVGVKVGEGVSIAGHRVTDPEQVVLLLAVLAEERRDWLMGAHATPIEDHALLSDGSNVALLSPAASVVWLCHPAPDSGAVFAALLGGPSAGTLDVHPASGREPLSQVYVRGTMTVRTRWAGLDVVDFLDRSHRGDPTTGHETRLVRVVTGSGAFRIVFAPRPEFGQVPVRLVPSREGVRVEGPAEPMVLVAPDLDWQIHREGMHEVATATVTATSEPYVVELRCGTDDARADPRDGLSRRALTEEHWTSWVAGLGVPTWRTDAVVRSALTLKALCHEPTGAILAAATTSLPEGIGGVRNWDYRFCWIRDSALVASALLRLGSTAEAEALLDWLHRVMDRTAAPERLHPLYSLEGVPLAAEAVVDSLPGYAGSRPVRVGNAAQGQVQLDVFGPVADLIHELARVNGRVPADDLSLLEACVDAVAARWGEADHGIWEIRDRPRQHVHSKVMCWVAVDRALKVLEMIGRDRPEWRRLRSDIEAEVLDRGWDDELSTFVCAYDRREADAAALHVVLSGLLPGDDPRVAGTIRSIESELRERSTVWRYRYDDGLPGEEGGMHVCTSWLIGAHARAGEREEAEELLRVMLLARGRTGLLPEQFDPQQERGLGNHPQAYSHLGVINAVLDLVERGWGDGAGPG
jgi:trehalose-phosphatase